jgi:hypothetical protein
MTVGGLVGGANILDLVFGGRNSQQYVGWVGKKGVTHQQFIRERSNQLNQMRQSGQTIDSRAQQTASNTAWNTLVERILKDEKIKALGLEVHSDEIYDFLLLTPPPAFQNNLTAQGLFLNDSNSFDLESYQTAVRNGNLPEELNSLLVLWENYLRTWLADRKLRNIMNNAATVSDYEVKNEYIKQNVNCTLEYIFVNTASITDSMITTSDDALLAKYNEDLDNYETPEKKMVEYVFWEIPAAVKLDTINQGAYKDSLMNQALLFADETDYSSFAEATIKFETSDIDTIDIHEDFSNNSGIPPQMGTLRSAVRFAFDNSKGTISDPIQTDNGIGVFHIIGSKSAGHRAFEDVKAGIRRSLLRDLKKDYAKFYLADNLSDDWKSLAEGDDLIEYLESDTKTIGGTFQSIGKSSELTGTLMAMESGSESPVLTTFNTACVVRMVNKDILDEAAYSEGKKDLKDQLINSKRSRGYFNWLNAAKEAANIEDFRSSSY